MPALAFTCIFVIGLAGVVHSLKIQEPEKAAFFAGAMVVGFFLARPQARK